METENKKETKIWQNNLKKEITNFCKKLRYGNLESPSTLLGLIEKEDDTFIWFRTANKTHRISKSAIVSIEDTNEIFRENKGDADGY